MSTDKVQDFERARRLVAERKRLGLSQTALAEAGGVSKGSQILYEKGRSPTADYLAGIDGVGVDLMYILTGRRSSEVQTSEPTENDILPSEFVPIPLYAARLAAGAGAENQAEPVIEHLAFRSDWLKRIGLSPSAACLARVQGDSMLPTLQPDDLVLIDTAQRNVLPRLRGSADIRPSPIFALRHDGGAVIKRVERISNDQLILLSDNPAHPPQLRSGADLEATEIIGKVVWWGHTVRE